MNPLRTLRIAARALWRNGMRSFLTALGIIIGVAAVIAMMAIGAGAKAQVEQAFAAKQGLRLVRSAESTALPSGQYAEADVGEDDHLRLTCRMRRRFFCTCLSVSTFFLPSKGFSPSLKTNWIGVPTSLKRLRKKFSR